MKIAKTLNTSYGFYRLLTSEVVKINAKYAIFGLMLIFLIGIVYAECGLEIDSVKVYVDGKKESLGSIDVKPESELELKIKVENTCSDDTKIDIEDIEIEVVIEGIDDGDDLEEDTDIDDLDTEDDDTVTITFDIPLEVEDDSYDLIIYVEGEQYNDSSIKYNDTEDGSVDVDKERHEIKFTRVSIGNERLKCFRTTELDISIVNIGRDDEDVVLQIQNSALDINIKDSDIPELDKDPFDSDSEYSNSYTITVPDDAAPGTYTLKITAKYSSKTKTETVSLTVEDCPKPVEEEEEEEEEVTTVITPPTTTTPTTGVIIQPPTTAVTEEKPAIDLLLIAIILGEVLVIVIGGIFAIRWAIKKR